MSPLRILVLLLGIVGAAISAADEFPYPAYIATDEVEVVAGPGHRFYATDRLARGTKVEIYREEPSGWLAIRPPEGSFSWIPADFVDPLGEDSLGRVKQATGAWVGTSVEHVGEHHQQVTLKAGELVQILAEKSVTAGDEKERKWLKIAPPAGEYRWVHLRDVSRTKPADPPPVAVAENVEAKETKNDRSLRHDRGVQPAQFRGQSSNSDSKSASSDGFVPRKRRDNEPSASPVSDSSARFAATTPLALKESSVSSAPIRTGLTSDEVTRQLDDAEVDLSLMLAKDRSQWNLPAIRRRVESLVESGADPAARGRARLMLDKIKQFDDAFDGRTVVSSTSQPAATPPANSPPTNASLADPRYDAQGTLKPVVSKKSDKPIAPYAVVDADGQPVCFISPSPGLNLNRYLNKQVGLYGRRGYLEELKKPHVVAERVIELDSRVR